MTTEVTTPSPQRAIVSVILSMGLLAVGSGLLIAFIPVQQSEKGFPPWVAGVARRTLAAGDRSPSVARVQPPVLTIALQYDEYRTHHSGT